VLLLFPAGLLIVMVLAAITVDLSIAFMGQRRLADAVTAAANDAATEGIANGAFYQENRIALDEAEVSRLVTGEIRRSLETGGYEDLQVETAVIPPRYAACLPTLQVRASATIGYVFAGALPGASPRASVASTSTAGPRQAAGGECD